MLKTTKFLLFFMALLLVEVSSNDYESYYEESPTLKSLNVDRSSSSATQEFWNTLYQWSIADPPKTKYNVMDGNNVCLTCPIDRAMYYSLRGDHSSKYTPPIVSITWTANLPNNRKVFFCRNNTRINDGTVQIFGSYDANGVQQRSGGDLAYACENYKLCLLDVKYYYAGMYECNIKTFVKSVQLNPIGKY